MRAVDIIGQFPQVLKLDDVVVGFLGSCWVDGDGSLGGGRGNRSRLGVYAHVGWWWGGVDYIVCFYWYLASCNQGGGICSLVLRDRCEGRLGCELEDGVALDMLGVGGCRWFGCYGCGGCGFCVCLCGGLRIHFE